MEINDQNIAALGQYLQQTLNPNAEERKKAEAFLKVKKILILFLKLSNFSNAKQRLVTAFFY